MHVRVEEIQSEMSSKSVEISSSSASSSTKVQSSSQVSDSEHIDVSIKADEEGGKAAKVKVAVEE